MKRLFVAVCYFVVLFFGAIKPSQATVILDATWADGTRTNTSLPTDSAWHASSSTSLSAAANVMTGTPSTGSSTRTWWTYFTTNPPVPVLVTQGQTFKATLTFTPTAGVVALNGNFNVRFGIFNWSAAARVTTDVTPSGTNVAGYLLNLNFGATLTNSPLQVMKRTKLTDVNLVTTTADFSLLGAGGGATGSPGFSNGVAYTLELSARRNADSVTVTAKISNTNGWSVSSAGTDISAVNSSFDTFAVYSGPASGTATSYRFTEMKIEVLPAVIQTNASQVMAVTPPGASATVTFSGATGVAYEVQRSLDLTNWVVLGTNTPVAGQFQIIDTFSDLPSAPLQAYYRARALLPVPPAITTQPQGQAVTTGQGASFTVAASGDAPLGYQWYFNAVPISGATNNTFNLNSATTNNAGNYAVLVLNNAGLVVSSNAALAVVAAPLITAQPTNRTVFETQPVAFAVAAGGAAPLSYQWYFNTNSPLAGATNSALTIASAQLTNSGGYSVIITNVAGSVTSVVATLMVIPAAPAFTTQPTNLTLAAGQNATFAAAATGLPPLTYLWYFNTNTSLSGATNTSLTISNAQTASNGSYQLVVTNGFGAVTSSVATLTVTDSVPIIIGQPQGQVVGIGQNASFLVSAIGTTPLSYQWYFNTNTALTGATNSSLTIANAQTTNGGLYTVVITNGLGAVTSSAAALNPEILPPPPPLPTIPAGNFNVTNYGAVGDGATTDTTAIQNAINAASAAGGGTVEIPAAAGAYLSGPITLKSSVNLQVDAGATLMALPMASWPGTTTFIMGSSLHDVEISGSGTIDGQGAAWWTAFNANNALARPNFIQFSSCNRILIQDITLQNPPTFHIMIKNSNADITVQRINISTSATSPNTDGFDIASSNVLIQNSSVSDGDDNVEIGGSQLAANITIANCTFGSGHGVSIGSITSGGVSNLVVDHCTFNGTDYGLRLKSDNSSSGNGGAGGLCQDLHYSNIGMTNINKGAIVLYSYYEEVGTPTSITPDIAATEPVAGVTSTTVVWRNITFSNLTATVGSSGTPGIIWGRIEMPVTNVTLANVQINGSKSFDIYNARNIQIIDPQLTVASPTFELFNSQFVVTNSAAGAPNITFDGITTNGLGNNIALYDRFASLSNTNALGQGPLTLGSGATLLVGAGLNLSSMVLNYLLDADTATNKLVVTGNLALGGTVNISAATGFASGTYTLMTYTGALSGNLPALGTVPAGHTCSFDTNTVGQVNLIVGP